MIVSTSGRSHNLGDSAEPQWEQMLARLVLSTCSGWVFDLCYLLYTCWHTEHQHLDILHGSSFTGTPVPGRNLVSIQKLVLILGTVMTSRSSLDSQQLQGWFVWVIILTITQALPLDPRWYPIFDFSSHLIREITPAHKSHTALFPFLALSHIPWLLPLLL